MPSWATRREFLSVCIGGVVGVSGCTTRFQESGTETPTFQSDPWSMVHFDAQNTGYAPDATGPRKSVSEQWSQFTSSVMQVDSSSPVLANGRVFTGRSTDGAALKAYSAADGTELWGFGSGVTNSTPAVAGESVYFGHDGVIYALDVATGSVEWSVETGGSLMTSVTVHDGTVYTAGGWRNQGLYAIHADSGDVEWIHTTSGGDGALLQVPPAVDDDGVVLAKSAASGTMNSAHIQSLDPDGDEQWRWESPISEASMSAPVVHDGSAFACVLGYGTVALDRQTGTVQWEHPVDNGRGLNGVVSGPAIADGVVYATSGGTELTAMTAADGTVNWTLDLELPTLASPVVTGEQLYIGTSDRGDDSDAESEVLGINIADGTVTWRWSAPNPVSTTPCVGGGTLFVTTDALVHALA